MHSAPEVPMGTAADDRWDGILRPRHALWKLLLFYGVYLGVGGLSQGLAVIPGIEIIFWPPVGILIATLLLNPKGAWPWLIAVAGAAELTCNAIWWNNPFP